MLNCPKCNSIVKEGQRFCTICGANLTELFKPKFPPELTANVEIQEKKIAQDPSNPYLYIKLGDAYYSYGFYEEALIQYQKAVALDEANFEVHLKSAEVYYLLGRLDKARVSCQKAFKFRSEPLEAKVRLFSLLEELELISEAIELGREIIKIDPKNLLVHKSLKKIFIKQNMEKEAIEELKRITTLLPLEPEAYKELARIYEKKKEMEAAFENYKKVLELGVKDEEALYFVGYYLYKKGNYDEAIKYFEELLRIDFSHILARGYLVLSYLKKDEIKKAKEIIDAINISLKKINDKEKELLSEVYFTLGVKCRQIYELEESEKNLQKSLYILDTEKGKKELAKTYALYGDTSFKNEKYSFALKFYEKAIEFDKKNLEYQEKLMKVKEIIASKRKKTAIIIFVSLCFLTTLVIAFFVGRHFATRFKKIEKITGLQAIASSYDGSRAWGGPYPPNNAVDGDYSTCWTEEYNAQCEGQWIMVILPTKKTVVKIGILPGFYRYNPRYGDLYWLNNRLKTVKLEFSDGSVRELFFEDEKGIKYFEFKPPITTEWIKLTVESYYPGQRWDDICISEIEVYGY